MAKDKVQKEEKKLPKAAKEVKQDVSLKKEKHQESKKWHAMGPAKDKCSCKNEFQDKRYGVGVRLHTRAKDCRRCTVCGNEKLT
jgi:hypothetical protein